jgi:peptide/nickel transport system substrate-binding protein
MRIGSRVLVVVSGLALSSLLTPALAQKAESRVVAAVSADVPTLDPSINHAIGGFNARINIFDALTDIGPDGATIPNFATSWEASPDAKSWTFTIRTGAVFHNGDPVTIDDVIYSYQKIMDDPKSPTRVHVSQIASIDRISDTQLRFNLKSSFAPFLRTTKIIAIISKRAFQEMGADAFGKRPVGSGPYRVVNWVKDDHIELEAFDKWWGGAPTIKSAWLKVVPNEAARSAALLTGEVDIVPELSAVTASTYANRPGLKVSIGGSNRVVYLGFNPAHPALANLKMRQAIDMAIDRNAITKSLLRGMAVPSGQIAASVSVGYDPTIEPTKFDPERAKQLVKESGYNGEPIPFQFPNDYILSANSVADAVAGYLQNVGINVKLEGMEYNAFYSLWGSKKLTALHMFLFAPNMLDADSPIFSIFVRRGERGYLFDDRVEALATSTRLQGDTRKRTEIMSELWRVADTYKPFSFLYNERQAVGMRSDIEWKPYAEGFVRFWQIRRTGASK